MNKKIEKIHWYVLCKMMYCSNLNWNGITLELLSGDVYKGEGVINMFIPTSSNGFDNRIELSLGCEVTPATWQLLKKGYTVWRELERLELENKKKLERGIMYIKPHSKKYTKTQGITK
tara:strand:- start:371 stop:724 length:354 start_codon:yes stop_codon:yes gene_type:complete